MTHFLEEGTFSVFSSTVSPSLIAAFIEQFSWFWSISLLILAISAMIVAILFMVPWVSKKLLPVPRDTRLADFLPFEQLLEDGHTLLCRDGTLVHSIEIEGYDYSFATLSERERQFQLRKQWLDMMAETGVHIRVFMLRNPVVPSERKKPTEKIIATIDTLWHRTFDHSFTNRQVIVLSLSSKRGKEALLKLQQATEHTLAALASYHPHLMSANIGESEALPMNLLEFWGRLISPISRPLPYGKGQYIADVLTADTVEFGGEQGLINFYSGETRLLQSVLGIRSLGDATDERLMQELQHLPGEVTIVQFIEPLPKHKASLLLLQQSRMMMATHFSANANAQFEAAQEAIEGLDETVQSLAHYSMALFLKASTLEALQHLELEIRKLCMHYGVTVVREGVAAQASWFAQFPSYALWPRIYKLFSGNLASLVTLTKIPSGRNSSDWGEGPIALFRTAGGTSYRFQFHVSEERDSVAHGVTIGPTGGGKTTLVCFLTAMAMRHEKLRCYLFDRFEGARIFCQAAGGKYLRFHSHATEPLENMAYLNPFQCQDSEVNRQFLALWLRHLANVEDASSLETIAIAVEEAFLHLPYEYRSLSGIFDACFPANSQLSAALKKWVDPTMYGRIFNHPHDTLDLTSTRLIGFDFTRIFADEELARAVLFYLMHRIQQTLKEQQMPALIFIDETEPMLRHPMFAHYFMVMLQEYRKLGAAVISAFQRPEAIRASGMSELLRGQAQTIYFLPNPAANEEDYKEWQLTDREWAFITGKLTIARRLKRAILLKRITGESVVLDTDFSVLGRYLKIFSSGRASIQLAERIQQECPSDWVEHYLDKS